MFDILLVGWEDEIVLEQMERCYWNHLLVMCKPKDMLISMRSKQLCYNRSVCSQTSSQVQPLSDNTEATPPRFDHWMVFTRLLFDGTLTYCVPWCTMLEAGTSCVADSGFLFRRLRPEKFWFVDVRGKKNNGPSNRKSETVNPGRQPNL